MSTKHPVPSGRYLLTGRRTSRPERRVGTRYLRPHLSLSVMSVRMRDLLPSRRVGQTRPAWDRELWPRLVGSGLGGRDQRPGWDHMSLLISDLRNLRRGNDR